MKHKHPWWHWFFTNLDSVSTGLFEGIFKQDNIYYNYSCSKCKKKWREEDPRNNYD